MTVDRILEERLTRFLEPYGITSQDLIMEVEESFGPPLLVVATGSVLQGFGNSRSDVDLNVVVNRTVTQVPIMSYTHRARVDTTFYAASDLRTWTELIRNQPWPPKGTVSPAMWLERWRALGTAARFATGLPLQLRAGWDEWISVLRERWFQERVAEWWRVESIRFRITARWLSMAKPLLACQRYCDAIMAALQSRAAMQKQLYLETYPDGKWLPEKLRVIGNDEGRAIVREALRTPARIEEVETYQSRSEMLLEELLPSSSLPQELIIQLGYAPGVETWRLNGHMLVTRWKMRGLELRGITLPDNNTVESVVWEGPTDAMLKSPILDLFLEDMLWLGVAQRDKHPKG